MTSKRSLPYSFVSEPQTKRHKINVACNVCKRRKTKCDGIRPVCGPCSRRKNGAMECIYRPEPASVAYRKENKQGGNENRAARTSSSKPVDCARSQPDTAEPTASVPRHPFSTFGTPAEISLSNEEFSSLPSEGLIDASTGSQFVRQIESAATGTLASNQKHNKALQTLPRLPLLIENKVFYETLFVLPTRRVADDLFTKYWEHIDPIFPWLDQGTITANYDMVWGDLALDMNEKAFHCILNLIFATSSMIGTTSEVYTHTQCASVYFDRAKQLMSFNLMEMHNLEVIQIFLLSAVYLQHTNLAQEFVQNIGLAIQIARTLGVQSRESCRLLTNKHEQDLAMRVWFGCIIMDRIAAMTFGSKPQISHEIVKKSAVPPTSAATQQVLRPNTPSSINGDFYSAFCHLHVILGDILESLYPLSSEHPSSPEFGASIPTEKDDILAPQKLTDLFRIESDLSTWYSGLPLQLQVGIGRTDSRIANVLHAR
ncbi:hypothetical protein ACMYSQ_004117 [Aspergillus niger]